MQVLRPLLTRVDLRRQKSEFWEETCLRGGVNREKEEQKRKSQEHTKGYQNRQVSKSQVMRTVKTRNLARQQFIPVWMALWHLKGIKTDGFLNGKYGGLSNLAILVHQQLWYPFGWFFGT